MYYHKESDCPCCRSGPIAFVKTPSRLILECYECGACFLDPGKVNLENIHYPDKKGALFVDQEGLSVEKNEKRYATMEEIRRAGWGSSVQGEWVE